MPIIIAVLAFGYFVDLMDLSLLAAVRVASLRDLGVADSEMLSSGVFLYNMQLGGMILGGVGWGIIGDKFGRTTILFGSISTYSVANILNASVSSVDIYGLLRFISGFGLAGELGAAVTLLSEALSKEHRGQATTLVIALGGLGSIFAGFLGDHLNWRYCYLLGGLLGASLLLARLIIRESNTFSKMASQVHRIDRGNLRLIYSSPRRLWLLVGNAAIGLPIYFLQGVLLVFLPELAVDLGLGGLVTVGRAAMFHAVGKATGSLLSGALSQRVGSRKKVIQWALVGIGLGISTFLGTRGQSAFMVYIFFLALGIIAGYWGIFMVMVAEQFGTNLRATFVSSVPSITRAGAILMTSIMESAHKQISLIWLLWIEGIVVVLLAYFSLRTLKESFGRNLEFLEGSIDSHIHTD